MVPGTESLSHFIYLFQFHSYLLKNYLLAQPPDSIS